MDKKKKKKTTPRDHLHVSKQDSDRVSNLSVPPQAAEALHSFYEDFTLRGIRVDRFHLMLFHSPPSSHRKFSMSV
ncbi:hypothetical protein Hdeb2414_s0007g00231791 [Helianthus debilis subsp. tardiflorus]